MNKNAKLSKNLFFSKTNEFLNIYLPTQAGKSRHTIKTYLDGLTVFRRYVTDEKRISMKNFLFEDCTHDFLLDYMSYLKTSGCKESTCNNRLAAVRAYLWYVADGDVSMQSIALGASRVPFLRETKSVKEILSPDICRALLAAPDAKSRFGIRDRTIMIVLYDTAIRVSELHELTVSSLFLDAEIPYIRVHGKGDKERVVSLTEKTVNHLKKYLAVFHKNLDVCTPLFYTVINGNLFAMSPGNVEYSCAAEPPFRCGVSHLSETAEPPNI